jgi:hypothetical protein
MAMRQEHETVAHQGSDSDRNPGDHADMLGANALSLPGAPAPQLQV